MVSFFVIVYRLTSPNGSRYIGQTIQKLTLRWDQHRYAARAGKKTPLYDCMRKHHESDFSLWTAEVVATAESQAMLDWLEVVWIAAEGDLNLLSGGEGLGPMCQATKDKISKANTGRKPTEEARRNMSRGQLGRTGDHISTAGLASISTANTGKVWSASSRRKLSASMRALGGWTPERRANHECKWAAIREARKS